VRDLDALEAEALAASGIVRLEVGAPAALGALLETWAAADRSLYLHLDLDVLDPAELVCNPWPAPGGLTRAGLGEVLATAARRLPPAAVGVTAYGPEFDRDGRGPGIVGETLRALLAETGRP
jgi:arginase